MTYSTNFGIPSIEATNWDDLQVILQKLPDNTAQLISPRDVRDAIYTVWEDSVFRTLPMGNNFYIGTDNGGTQSNYRYTMFFGKKELQVGNSIMSEDLVNSDTDIFFYNNKSDDNLSLQDTKLTFLAGSNSNVFDTAPYLKAFAVVGTAGSRIDLELNNPSDEGVIEINSNTIQLGSNGWVIEEGNLYPTIPGSTLGIDKECNRITSIYMDTTSSINYIDTLTISPATGSNTIFHPNGKVETSEVFISGTMTYRLGAIEDYVLTVAADGTAEWQPASVSTNGIDKGYVLVADGVGSFTWEPRAYGGTSGYILKSGGQNQEPYWYEDVVNSGATAGYLLQTDSNGNPVWLDFEDIITSATAGYILISNGTNVDWINVDTISSPGGINREIQFNDNGVFGADNNFVFSDTGNLGLGTNLPTYKLHIEGDLGITTGNKSKRSFFEQDFTTGEYTFSERINSGSNETIQYKVSTSIKGFGFASPRGDLFQTFPSLKVETNGYNFEQLSIKMDKSLLINGSISTSNFISNSFHTIWNRYGMGISTLNSNNKVNWDEEFTYEDDISSNYSGDIVFIGIGSQIENDLPNKPVSRITMESDYLRLDISQDILDSNDSSGILTNSSYLSTNSGTESKVVFGFADSNTVGMYKDDNKGLVISGRDDVNLIGGIKVNGNLANNVISVDSSINQVSNPYDSFIIFTKADSYNNGNVIGIY